VSGWNARTVRHPAAGRNGAPEQTHAENYYYQKQIQGKTPVVVVMKRWRKRCRGVIEWYDRNCIKVNRSNASALLVYKPSIRYNLIKPAKARP